MALWHWPKWFRLLARVPPTASRPLSARWDLAFAFGIEPGAAKLSVRKRGEKKENLSGWIMASQWSDFQPTCSPPGR